MQEEDKQAGPYFEEYMILSDFFVEKIIKHFFFLFRKNIIFYVFSNSSLNVTSFIPAPGALAFYMRSSFVLPPPRCSLTVNQ